MTLRHSLAVGLLTLSVAGVMPALAQRGGGDGKAPDRVAIEMPKARIASLSERVQSAVVAPDGKIWLQMKPEVSQPGGGYRQLDMDTVQDIIEREWEQPMPQISGARVALFEPGPGGKGVGRVWFAFNGPISLPPESRYGSMLLGFDGKKWLERAASDTNGGSAFTGGPMMVGANAQQGNNVYVAGTAFFASTTGVYSYDGKSWSSRDLGAERSYYAPRLVPEPDNKGLLAISQGNYGHNLYRWRDGKWSKLMGSTGDNDRVNIQAVVPTEKGAWVMHSTYSSGYNTVTFLPFDPTPTIPVEKLIEQLKDKDFKAREEATVALIARGEAASSKIAEALKANENDEVKYRLEYIKANLTKVTAVRGSYSGYPTFTVGTYNLNQPSFLTYLPDGRALLGAITVRDGGGSQGIPIVLIMDAKGSWSKLTTGEDAVSPMRHTYGNQAGAPVLVDGGKKVWLAGDGYNTPCTLVDIEKQTVVARTPMLTNAQLLGATPDGKLLLQTQSGVMVFDKDAPDTRVALTIKDSMASTYFMNVSDDGTVWAQDSTNNTLKYFDGTKWQTNEQIGKVRLRQSIVPGRNGAILCDTDRDWTLVTKEKVIDSDSIEDLIQSNLKEFQQAFGGPRLAPRNPNYSYETVSLQADKAGNIWMVRARSKELKVLVKDKWVDASDALRAAGSKTAQVGLLAGVGDMSKVFVTDPQGYGTGAISAIGEVNDKGEISFKALPRSDIAQRGGRPLYDRDGGLWTTGIEHNTNRGDVIIGMRITEKGLEERIDNGLPILVDKSDNVWLRPNYYSGTPGLTLWRGGKTVKAPAVPATMQDNRLFSDKPGSVYVWTDLGLQHLKAEKPDDPGTYARGRLYSIDALEGRPQQMEYSPLGFLVTITNRRTGGYQLSLIEVPR